MMGSSWEERRERAREADTADLGECLKSKPEDDASVASALMRGAAAARVANSLKAKAGSWSAKAEATLAKAQSEIARFQQLEDSSRARAAKIERTASAHIKRTRSQQSAQRKTVLDMATDMVAQLRNSLLQVVESKKDKKGKKDKKAGKKDKKAGKDAKKADKAAKRKGKADKAAKNQEQANMITNELKKAFQALLSKVRPTPPIAVQTVAINATDDDAEDASELGEEMELGSSCDRASRPTGQTYSVCIRDAKWTKFETDIRAASGSTGPYKSGTKAQGVVPRQKCKSADCKKNSKKELVCGTKITAGGKKAKKKCACARRSDASALGLEDWTQEASLGENAKIKAAKKDSKAPKVDKGKKIKYPVQSTCEQKYMWPSYKYVSNDTDATEGNTTTLVPQFGDCECVAEKKATCTLTAPDKEGGIPGITCELKKQITSCDGAASKGMNDTALLAHVNTWCESGYAGL
jgi:hypothetical protein